MSATPQVKEIWTLIKEIRKDMKKVNNQVKKLSLEIDKLRAGQKESNQRMKRLSMETNKQINQTDIDFDKYIRDTDNYWGNLGENLIEGNLAQRLKERGIKIDRVATHAKKGGVEFDIIAMSGTETVVVEVTGALDSLAIESFKKNIKQFKTQWSVFAKKKIYGAMVFLIESNRQSEKLAEKEGFFVISGIDDVIIKNKKSFKPKSFS